MRNFLFGYLFARAVAGERTARLATVAVILAILLFVVATAGSTLTLFRKSFVQGVQDGLRMWDNAPGSHSRQARRSGNPVTAPVESPVGRSK
jgi:hypothetical protein